MKAVIYSRVSTDHQSEGSVEQQIRKCREYCAFKDYEVVEVYSDVGSGMKTERKGYEKMMEDIDTWEITVAYKLDRFHRSAANAATWAADLNARNKNFAAIDIDIDTVTPMGRFIFTLMSSLAQLEVEMTRERTKMGLDAVRHQGRKLGPPPYGYDSKFKITGKDSDKGFLVVNTTEAEIVKIIFQCREKALSLSEICEHLIKSGIKTKKGKLSWSPATISGILKNERLYNGVYELDGEEKQFYWGGIL